MKVGSQLESAQLEIVDNASEAMTDLAMVKYNKDKEAISIKGTTEILRTFPVPASSLAEFRSAMFPVGALQYSSLATQEFLAEMGAAWMNVRTLLKDYDGGNTVADGKALIPATSAFGQILLNRGATTRQVGGVDWPEWNSPEGKYLRASGTTNGTSYSLEQPLANQNKEHSHEYSRLKGNDAQLFGYALNQSGDNVSSGYTTSTNGGYESRPESVVYNLYLKVER